MEKPDVGIVTDIVLSSSPSVKPTKVTNNSAKNKKILAELIQATSTVGLTESLGEYLVKLTKKSKAVNGKLILVPPHVGIFVTINGEEKLVSIPFAVREMGNNNVVIPAPVTKTLDGITPKPDYNTTNYMFAGEDPAALFTAANGRFSYLAPTTMSKKDKLAIKLDYKEEYGLNKPTRVENGQLILAKSVTIDVPQNYIDKGYIKNLNDEKRARLIHVVEQETFKVNVRDTFMVKQLLRNGKTKMILLSGTKWAAHCMSEVGIKSADKNFKLALMTYATKAAKDVSRQITTYHMNKPEDVVIVHRDIDVDVITNLHMSTILAPNTEGLGRAVIEKPINFDALMVIHKKRVDIYGILATGIARAFNIPSSELKKLSILGLFAKSNWGKNKSLIDSLVYLMVGKNIPFSSLSETIGATRGSIPLDTLGGYYFWFLDEIKDAFKKGKTEDSKSTVKQLGNETVGGAAKGELYKEVAVPTCIMFGASDDETEVYHIMDVLSSKEVTNRTSYLDIWDGLVTEHFEGYTEEEATAALIWYIYETMTAMIETVKDMSPTERVEWFDNIEVRINEDIEKSINPYRGIELEYVFSNLIARSYNNTDNLLMGITIGEIASAKLHGIGIVSYKKTDSVLRMFIQDYFPEYKYRATQKLTDPEGLNKIALVKDEMNVKSKGAFVQHHDLFIPVDDILMKMSDTAFGRQLDLLITTEDGKQALVDRDLSYFLAKISGTNSMHHKGKLYAIAARLQSMWSDQIIQDVTKEAQDDFIL